MEEGQDDSAIKTLQAIAKSSKMLKAGHALVDKQSIQKRFAGAPGPTSLYRYDKPSIAVHTVTLRCTRLYLLNSLHSCLSMQPPVVFIVQAGRNGTVGSSKSSPL